MQPVDSGAPVIVDEDDYAALEDIKTKLYHVRSDAPDNISEEGKLMFGVLKEVFIETLGKQ